MSASYPTKMLLAIRSGNKCAHPNCDKELVVDGEASDAAIIGEAAHIAGEKPRAARYDHEMTDEGRDHYDNLIYLCSACHTRVDKQEEDFPVSKLLDFKREHENKVRDAVNEAFADVNFPELHHATNWISSASITSGSDFSLIPLKDKMVKNGLSTSVRGTIAMGLSISKLVGEFVEAESQIDTEFSRRLVAGFLQEYYRLRKEGFFNDELFDLMCFFSQRGFSTQAQKSAGVAILIYLFERCDVFEK